MQIGDRIATEGDVMNPKLEDRLRKLNWDEIRDWVDDRTAQRGWQYRDRVGEFVALNDCLAAKVHGTEEYTTNLSLDSCGEFVATCTCPVGRDCKHGVALALRASEALKTGKSFGDATDAAQMRVSEANMSDVFKKRREQEEAARLKRDEEERKRREAEALAEAKVAAFKIEIARLVRETRDSFASRDRNTILAAVDKMLDMAAGDEILWFENDFSDEDDAVASAMHDLFPALLESGMTPADVLVWSCELTRPYGRYDTCYSVSPDPWEVPGPEYDRREVWLDVAERLTRQLDSLPPGEDDGGPFSIYSHLLPYIRKAYCRAGREELAIPVYLRHVAKTERWFDAVELASACGEYDAAIEFGRRGFREMDPNCYPDQNDLLAMVADIFAAQGDFIHAAAILAEVFLSWGGVCRTNLTVDAFHRVVDMAARAGVGREVRTALIHALETGINPVPLQYWKYEPPKQVNPWQPVAKPVVYRPPWASPEPPPWPLPPSNEGIRLFESRWMESKDECQSYQKFLVRLALAEGDRAEVARRFCALPAFPCTMWPQLHPEVKELIDSVRLAMVGYRPDIVNLIDNPKLHWTWRRRRKELSGDDERSQSNE